ncbi:unnamed protein product, partial [Ectocarpus fasciculatus]
RKGDARSNHRCTSREGETMRVFEAATALPFMVLRLVASASGEADRCDRVVVEVSTPEHATYSGTFYQACTVGTSLEGAPLFKTDGGLCLQFVDGGSADEEEEEEEHPPLLLHVGAHAAADSEPPDDSLDFDMSDVAEEAEPVFRRSLTATCGHWVIGKMGTADAAMYPMIKVSDCARHPAFIDEDSAWFRQDCFDCKERGMVGKVKVATETCPCSSNIFKHTSLGQERTTTVASVARTNNNPSPGRGNEEGEHSRTTPEMTMPTPAPTLTAAVDETSTPAAAVGGDGVIMSDDVTSAETSSGMDGGDIAAGVSLGVGAAVLLIASMVAFEMRTFLCGRAR